jgi:pimeloyl-ACP methyl ester carboxylesterase
MFPVLIFLLASCFPSAKVPVDTISYPYSTDGRQDCLLVFLPGRGDSANDFETQGFIRTFRQRGMKADALAVDLNIGYYMDMTAIERLRYDVITPARDRGYRNILLIGISIGGLAALEYERKYPGEVAEIVLLAPYMGGDEVVDEIVNAGGISKWYPGRISRHDYERHIWAWIKQYKSTDRRRPVIYLGYGTHDRFARSERLLSDAVGADRTITRPGGHAWSTWKILWGTLSERISCSDNKLVDAEPAEYNK